jgi:hypothetical protein
LSLPVVVAERNPGSVAALELAAEHSDRIGAVVLVSSNISQFFASPRDPVNTQAMYCLYGVRCMHVDFLLSGFVSIENKESVNKTPKLRAANSSFVACSWK